MANMDPKKPDEPPPLKDSDLQSVFDRWEQAREALPTGLPTEDAPLTEEEVALDHEVARRPEALVARARTAARTRLTLACLLSAVSLLTLFLNRHDFAYYLTSESDRVDLGDIRERFKRGERPGDGAFPELEHNRWVRFENGIMVEERESERGTGTRYYFDPVLKAVVVTPRDLPQKNSRVLSIHEGFAELINHRWILPHDLSASFSAQGRLLKADEAPHRYRGVIRSFREFLRLDERLAKEDTLWLFLDGANPSAQVPYVAIYAVALLVMLLGFYFYWRARRRLTALEESLRLTQSSPS